MSLLFSVCFCFVDKKTPFLNLVCPFISCPGMLYGFVLFPPLHLYFAPTSTPRPAPPSRLIPFICTQHILPHLSWPVYLKKKEKRTKKKKKTSFLSLFTVQCTDPILTLRFQTHPPVSLRVRNPTHLLSPALSWGLINLVKSQSAFHSITITLYPVWCSMLGGIRMITGSDLPPLPPRWRRTIPLI